MRHALVLWLALFAIVVVSQADCSITHKSGEFACGPNLPQCADGRECVDGFCIIPGSNNPDAGVDARGSNHGDASNGCPSQCTSCDLNAHTCTVDCTKTNCNNQINCPLGFSCDIQCTTADSCRNGVNCTSGSACTIECSGDSSCRNIACGAGPCDVTCSGNQSCRNVGCGNSCRCDVMCDPGATCEGVSCTFFQCKDAFGGCNSQSNAICNTCP